MVWISFSAFTVVTRIRTLGSTLSVTIRKSWHTQKQTGPTTAALVVEKLLCQECAIVMASPDSVLHVCLRHPVTQAQVAKLPVSPLSLSKLFWLASVDMHIDTSAGLVHSAELYMFADNYMVKDLAIASHEAIKSMLDATNPDEITVSDITRLLEYAYQVETEAGESDPEVGSLRVTVKNYVADNITTLSGIREFQEFLERGGKVVSDIMNAVVRRKLA
jgi:hypothetical protein